MKAKLAPKCSWSCTLNALKSFSNFCPCLGNKVFNYDHYFFWRGWEGKNIQIPHPSSGQTSRAKKNRFQEIPQTGKMLKIFRKLTILKKYVQYHS